MDFPYSERVFGIYFEGDILPRIWDKLAENRFEEEVQSTKFPFGFHAPQQAHEWPSKIYHNGVRMSNTLQVSSPSYPDPTLRGEEGFTQCEKLGRILIPHINSRFPPPKVELHISLPVNPEGPRVIAAYVRNRKLFPYSTRDHDPKQSASLISYLETNPKFPQEDFSRGLSRHWYCGCGDNPYSPADNFYFGYYAHPRLIMRTSQESWNSPWAEPKRLGDSVRRLVNFAYAVMEGRPPDEVDAILLTPTSGVSADDASHSQEGRSFRPSLGSNPRGEKHRISFPSLLPEI